ncbi:UNVERIFIED_CONTAM: putative pectinesterase/pectinesterase inhibitor 61 [Sesamum calycinum]|uniref:Pectinesterase/pectinesterase inhibitor 61 n=1 Tax=Sesamum calycinum TaxID=2727403 RepID=A0AAW2RQS1_9LAMI
MEYGRLGKAEPGGSSTRTPTPNPNPTPKKSKIKLLLILAATLMVASAISAALVVVIRNRANSGAGARLHNRRPSQAMSRACSRTLYPSLCLNSLLDFPGAITASDQELVHISVNMTLQKVGRALFPRLRSAISIWILVSGSFVLMSIEI